MYVCMYYIYFYKSDPENICLIHELLYICSSENLIS